MDGELKHQKIRHGAGQMTALKTRMALKTFFRHDFKAGLTVFFVALPLCLGVALASGVPVYSGLISGIVGGLVISLLSNSPLSVSGPAAGLTAITVHAIQELGSVQLFFLAGVRLGIRARHLTKLSVHTWKQRKQRVRRGPILGFQQTP